MRAARNRTVSRQCTPARLRTHPRVPPHASVFNDCGAERTDWRTGVTAKGVGNREEQKGLENENTSSKSNYIQTVVAVRTCAQLRVV